MLDQDTLPKIVTGLRQISQELSGGNPRIYGMEAHADRISGFAAELADAIGFKEPSADLIAARELAAQNALAMGRTFPLIAAFTFIDEAGSALFQDDPVGAAARFRAGRADSCCTVVFALRAIEEGRRLAAVEADQQRARDMASAPRDAASITPDHLTITIDGPAGSGKTILAELLQQHFPHEYRPAYHVHAARLDPRIIEMREGRRFDVRADAFLDTGAEG